MKYARIIGMMVLSLLIPAAASAKFDSNLRYGSKGKAVTELQEFLTDEGLYTGPITGNFYSLTLKGVKNFQNRENLAANGYFNTPTRLKANAIIETTLAEADAEADADPDKPDMSMPPGIAEILKKQADQAERQTALLTEQNKLLEQQATAQAEQTKLFKEQADAQKAQQQKTDKQLADLVVNTAPPAAAPVQELTVQTPMSQARLEILKESFKGFCPWASDGKDRETTYNCAALPAGTEPFKYHNANSTALSPEGPENQNNSVILGLVVYKDDGSLSNDAVVTVTATDSRQNRTIKGTYGGLGGYEIDQTDTQKRVLDSVFIYRYYFYEPGDHTITFSTNGMSKSVTVNAQ